MIRTLTIFLVLASAFCGAIAQETHTLLTIDNKNYSAEEFSYIYNKNNSLEKENRSKKEYLDLFVNYKLKVVEAMNLGLDTMPAFVKEFTYYSKEVVKPYLTDTEVTERLLHEAYNRLKYEVDAAHILIKVDANALPEDTLKAYNKLLDIKQQIENGASFEDMAAKYSQDPSAVKNKGRLGYFKGFMMVYPFEKAAYETEVGELSQIIRTRFGYHLIKVYDKRLEQGQVKTAHIMVMFPSNANAELKAQKRAKIDSVYQLVLQGDDFGALASIYSEDRVTANKNGELPWFGSGQMIPEFSNAAFALDSIHDISPVIESPYGYHIIKLLDKKSLESYEELESSLKEKIKRDERASKGTESLVNKLKAAYNYTENEDVVNLMFAKEQELGFTNKTFASYLINTSATIANFAKDTIKTDGLAIFMDKNIRRYSSFKDLYNAFVSDAILTYEEAHLAEKYPEYKYLVEEYHDGLLIFDLSQKEVWNRANEDTLALAEYFDAHQNQYFTPDKLEGEAVFCANKKVYTIISEAANQQPSASLADVVKQLNINNEVKLITGTIERGQYKVVDKQVWSDKKSDGLYDKKFPMVYTRGDKMPKEMLTIDEAKGQVIADFQSYLEQEWVKKLRDKYNLVIQTKALKYAK